MADTTGGTSCLFCAIAAGELTPGLLAYRDGHTAVFPSLHQQPRNQGHMLVVPVVHVAQIYDVDGLMAGPLMTTVAKIARVVKSVFAADGIVVRQNNEAAGGQDVFHVHFHVIPRFVNDRFDVGDARFPFGVMRVPEHERAAQAQRVREAIGRLGQD